MIRRSWPKALIAYASIEVIAAAVGTAGIVVEFIYGAHIGLILVTMGGVLYGVGAGLWSKVFVASK